MEPGVYTCNLTVRFRICVPFFEYSQVFLAPNKITVAVAERCLPLDDPSARFTTTTEGVGETIATTVALGNETGASIYMSLLQVMVYLFGNGRRSEALEVQSVKNNATKVQWLLVGGGGIASVFIIAVFVAAVIKSRNKRKKIVNPPPFKNGFEENEFKDRFEENEFKDGFQENDFKDETAFPITVENRTKLRRSSILIRICS
uniref:Uncharacterized protein n=1 Tax=Romanomermis culicivorax TaxID=13658 RepID=A0A915L877_ROMCU